MKNDGRSDHRFAAYTLRGFSELLEKETWAELGYEADLN